MYLLKYLSFRMNCLIKPIKLLNFINYINISKLNNEKFYVIINLEFQSHLNVHLREILCISKYLLVLIKYIL